MSTVSNSGGETTNFAYLCRLCLRNDDESMDDIFPLAQKVEFVTRLAVSEGDGLPTFICNHCTIELDSSCNFINRSVNTDLLLRSKQNEAQASVEDSIVVKEEVMEDVVEVYDDPDIDFAVSNNLDFQTDSPSNTGPNEESFVQRFSVVDIPAPPEDEFETEYVEAGTLIEQQEVQRQNKQTSVKMYYCNLCDESFNMKAYLNLHLMSHAVYAPSKAAEFSEILGDIDSPTTAKPDNIAKKMVVCNVCGLSFDRAQKLLVHERIHLAPKLMFDCKECSKTFRHEFRLKLHMKVHLPAGEQSTRVGAKPTVRPAKRVPANKKVASKVKAASGKSLVTVKEQVKSRAVKKSASHTSNPSTSARVGRNVVRPSKSRKPPATNSTDSEPTATTFPCPTCAKMFSTKKSMLSHAASHGRKSPAAAAASFPCTTCNKKFASHKSMLFHAERHKTKSPKKSYSCSICDKTFATNKDLLGHRLSHAKDRAIKCSKCSKCFSDRISLRLHVKVIHAKHCRFKCSQCGEEFGSRLHLTHHKRFHADEKPYKCVECGEAFVDEVNLLCHFKVHASKPAFDCDKCGGEFADQAALTKHAKSHDLVQKSVWTCDLCGRDFTKKASLIKHVKSHAVNKCGKCGEEFETKHLLTTHVQFHDEDNPYKCAECGNEFADEAAMFDHFKSHVAK